MGAVTIMIFREAGDPALVGGEVTKRQINSGKSWMLPIDASVQDCYRDPFAFVACTYRIDCMNSPRGAVDDGT